MSKRSLRSLCLAGIVMLVGASATPLPGALAAAKLITVTGDGYTISIPSTWKQAKLALTNMFSSASLKHLAPSAALLATADVQDAVAAIVQHHTTGDATIKSIENTMIHDNSKLVRPVNFQTSKQGSATFITATSVSQDHGKTIAQLVAGTTYKGKTFYFLAAMVAGNSAKAQADANEVIAALGSIALR
jgi:hypothetical protein